MLQLEDERVRKEPDGHLISAWIRCHLTVEERCIKIDTPPTRDLDKDEERILEIVLCPLTCLVPVRLQQVR